MKKILNIYYYIVHKLLFDGYLIILVLFEFKSDPNYLDIYDLPKFKF